MSWIFATLLSALFLGLYDLCKKHALRANAIVPVLFFSTACGAAFWFVLLLLQASRPSTLPATLLVDPISWHGHLLLLAKSALVGTSWIFAYFGIKHLPLSLASPVRATGPLWTFMGALLILGERPSGLALAGIATTLASFLGLSFAGSREGVHFQRNKGVWFLVIGTLLGAASGLYDKYLLGSLHLRASTVQAWFSIYLLLVFTPLALGWKFRLWPRNAFEWRWSIPGIAACLLVADFVYFDALRDPEALISVVSSLRRASTLVAFAGGILLYKERNAGLKLPAVLGILVGITLTLLG